jgi:uncharacterized protein (DUF433 family)
MENVISQHIQQSPTVCGGKPRIAGTRVRVQDVVVWHDHWGLCPEEIVAEFPHLTLSDVYAALAYYHDHPDEIYRLLQEEEAFADRLEAQQPSLLKRIREQPSGQDDSVSSG